MARRDMTQDMSKESTKHQTKPRKAVFLEKYLNLRHGRDGVEHNK
jgi:hypothetical protein